MALFVANLFALVRPGAATPAGPRNAPSPAPGPAAPYAGNKREGTPDHDLPQAPIARWTVTYLVIGFVVMIWGIVSPATA